MAKKGIDWSRIKKTAKGIGSEIGKGADWYFGVDLKNRKKKQPKDILSGHPMDNAADEFFGFNSRRDTPKIKKKKKNSNIKVIVIRG